MWSQHHVSNHSFDWFQWVLKKQSTPSSDKVFPLFLSVVAIHAFVNAFSITGNQRRDYYDSIQCALMVGSNLFPNHTIAVINLLSALVPVPCCNLLPERQRARLENREKKSKDEERQRLVNVRLMDQETTSFYWGIWVWVGEWVFSLHNIVLKQESKRTGKEKWSNVCYTHTHTVDVSSNMQ